MTITLGRADARHLPLPDESVDLIITSPPYFGLRSYTDAGEHYAGQIGSETTPAQYVAALLECTREWVRILKPSGSMFINLGDKYAGGGGGPRALPGSGTHRGQIDSGTPFGGLFRADVAAKSLMGLPWRYALACMDDLGLILRAEIIWAKPNGLPESVTDRVRRSHEQVFHFTRQPRYYSAVDEVREPQQTNGKRHTGRSGYVGAPGYIARSFTERALNPLGKLPGSVWEIPGDETVWKIPSQPLTVPECRLVLGGRTVRWFMTWREGHAHMRRLARYGWDGPGRPGLRPEIGHFAAFPMELPRRAIAGWSPPGICTACGEGRRPVTHIDREPGWIRGTDGQRGGNRHAGERVGQQVTNRQIATITGYACACPQPDAPTRPAIVADPFGGTGTTALAADALGRHGLSFDRSADYCRLARWRTTNPGERAKAAQVTPPPPRHRPAPDQPAMF